MNQNQNNKLVVQDPLKGINLSTSSRSSEKLICCLIKMDIPEQRQDAKMELVSITSELMPKGAPNLLGVVQYPMISRLCQEIGKKGVLLMIFTLVRDLCNSVNVVRNMNEDQMIESASMLLDECGDFRLEDYVMMFAMAKRGQLVKIYDRIDIDVIGEMMDTYWFMRRQEGLKKQEEEYREFEESLKLAERTPGKVKLGELEMMESQMSAEAIEAADKLVKIYQQMSGKDDETLKKEEEERRKRIAEHQNFYKRHMTPEQIQEAEDRKRKIESAASIYELEQKEKKVKK